MPRPLRIEYANAWYHVMNRGAGYRDIYTSTKHRQIFLEVVKEAIDQFEIEVHAYCLMSNHYHLLIKTPHANLGRAMRHINGVYTQRFNKDQKTDGPLFRGRYKALVIEKDAYLLQVSRYIHLNPIAAKIAKSLEAYPWSSYLDYVNKESRTAWLKVDEVRSMLNTSSRRLAYMKFVGMGVDIETQEFYEKKNMPVILGGKAFKEKILSHFEEAQLKSSQADYNKTKELPGMGDVENICAQYFKVDKKRLHERYGNGNDARKIAIYGSRVWAKEKLSVIADYYYCQSHSSVSNAVKSIKKQIEHDSKFGDKIKKIHKMLLA
jgi:putative transposase